MSLINILDSLIKLEARTAELYAELAATFSDVPTVHNFWKGMSQDEEAHKKILGQIRDLVRRKELEEIEGWKLEEEAAEQLSKTLDSLAKKMSGGEGIKLSEALKIAAAIESIEYNSIYRGLPQFMRAQESQLPIEATIAMTAHLKRLKDFTDFHAEDREVARRIRAMEYR